MLLTVGIPTFNRPDALKQTLFTNVNSIPSSVELLLVNNGTSQFDYEDAEAQLKYRPNSGMVHFADNCGWFESFRRTIMESRGKYVLFLSDEDILGTDGWDRLLYILEKYNSPMFALRELKPTGSDFLNSDRLIRLSQKILLSTCNYISGLVFNKELALEQLQIIEQLKHEEFVQIYPQVVLSWMLSCKEQCYSLRSPSVTKLLELPSDGVTRFGEYWLPTHRVMQHLSALRCMEFLKLNLEPKESLILKRLEKRLRDNFFNSILLSVKTIEPGLVRDLLISSRKSVLIYLIRSLIRGYR